MMKMKIDNVCRVREEEENEENFLLHSSNENCQQLNPTWKYHKFCQMANNFVGWENKMNFVMLSVITIMWNAKW